LAFGASSTASAVGQDHKHDSRPALALVGSASETTREQLLYAEAHNGLNILYLDPMRLIENDIAEIIEVDKNLRSALDLGHDVALVVRSSREEIAATQRLAGARPFSHA